MIYQLSFLNFEIYRPLFWAKKQKPTEMRRGGTLMLDYSAAYTRKVYNCRVWSFFRFENIENLHFYFQKTKPPFFEFRFLVHNSTSNNSVYQCRIFLESYF